MDKELALLIFDLDGLLVDTEHLFFQAFKSVAKKFGKSPNFKRYTQEVMSSGKEIAQVMGLPEKDAVQLRQQVFDKYRQLIRNANLRKGTIACLERFKNYDCVLVTGSKREYCDYLLKKFSMDHYFKKVITRDDGFPQKPDPAIFQYLLSFYKRNPWECLVIEDSKRGIMAALKLGIPCIYIPTDYVKSEELSPKVRKLKSLEQLTKMIVEEVVNEWQPKADHTLVNLYRDNIARLTDTFTIYKAIYGLREFCHRDSKIVPEAFDYARKRSFFIILILTTKDGRTYFQRSFDSGHLTMIPPGGALHLEHNDTMLHAINRIATRILKNAHLADVAPIIYLRNIFESEDGKSLEHIGLGVRAILNNDAQEIEKYEQDISVKGAFIRNFPSIQIPQAPARKAYECFLQWSNSKDYTTYLNEIETQHKVLRRYRLHQSVVNPLFVLLSRIFRKYSIPQVKQKIINYIGTVSSCVDVACGDDKGIFKLLHKIPLVVANDISTDQVDMLESYYNKKHLEFPKAHTIIFTNHDCLDLPFRDNAFDISLCRNLLHHMQSAKDLEALLENMKRIAKRSLIVEIEDPSHGNWWDRMRHKYYLEWLKDEGRHFYNRSDFEKVIENHFSGDFIQFDYLPTVRGTYMIAMIEKSL